MKAALFALALTGCASIGNQGMSAEQLKAAAADKSFSAVCQTLTGVWGTEKFVYTNVDKGSVPNGADTAMVWPPLYARPLVPLG